MSWLGAGAAAALALAQVADDGAVDDRYTFFSQPGADRAQVLADLDEEEAACAA